MLSTKGYARRGRHPPGGHWTGERGNSADGTRGTGRYCIVLGSARGQKHRRALNFFVPDLARPPASARDGFAGNAAAPRGAPRGLESSWGPSSLCFPSIGSPCGLSPAGQGDTCWVEPAGGWRRRRKRGTPDSRLRRGLATPALPQPGRGEAMPLGTKNGCLNHRPDTIRPRYHLSS